MSPALENAWLDVLRAECAASTQSAVAKRLQVSSSMVNQALQGRYKGNLDRLKARVEGVFMGETVDCPVIGSLRRDRCIEYQGRKFAATNPLRVALSIACKSCPNRRAS